MSAGTPDYLERTALAWIRTGLSVVGAGGVVARLAALDRSWVAFGVALVGLLAGAILVLPQAARLRGGRSGDRTAMPAAVGAVACTGLATVILVVFS